MDAADFFSTPARQVATLDEVAHRPWPLPDGSYVMGQTWDDLLFAHWRLPPSALRDFVPRGLTLDTFDGDAWLGITPFRLRGFRVRALPPLPVFSNFLELNVRTYVTAGEKPGILFFSLDVSRSYAAAGARRFYKLPYFVARMSASDRGGWVDYASRRVGGAEGEFEFRGRYRPTGEVFNAEPGTLEYFLAERYCLYTTDEGGQLHRAEIHHPPWPLQVAEAEIVRNTMPPPGVHLPDAEPLLHFARRQDVVIWRLAPVG